MFTTTITLTSSLDLGYLDTLLSKYSNASPKVIQLLKDLKEAYILELLKEEYLSKFNLKLT